MVVLVEDAAQTWASADVEVRETQLHAVRTDLRGGPDVLARSQSPEGTRQEIWAGVEDQLHVVLDRNPAAQVAPTSLESLRSFAGTEPERGSSPLHVRDVNVQVQQSHRRAARLRCHRPNALTGSATRLKPPGQWLGNDPAARM